jgi:hypothetical protein
MKEKIAKNWEKIALAVSVALVLAYLIVGVGMAKENKLIGEADRNTRDLKTQLDERPVTLPAKADTLGAINGAFAPAMTATPGETHVYTRVPEIAMNVEIIRDISTGMKTDPKKQPVLMPPALATPSVEPGTITLNWTDSEETKNIAAEDMTFVVYRKGPGEKELKKITPEPVTDRTFTDTAVKPKGEYAYVVAVRVTKPEVLSKLATPPPGGEVKSDSQTAVAAAILKLELKGVAEIPLEPDQPPVPTAQLMVRKFIDGGWRSKLYLIRKGDKIGSATFTTGFLVEDLARVTIKRTEEYTVPKFDDKGVKVGEEVKKRTREVQTWEMKYKDETGKVQKLHPATGAPKAPAPAPKTEKPE